MAAGHRVLPVASEKGFHNQIRLGYTQLSAAEFLKACNVCVHHKVITKGVGGAVQHGDYVVTTVNNTVLYISELLRE